MCCRGVKKSIHFANSLSPLSKRNIMIMKTPRSCEDNFAGSGYIGWDEEEEEGISLLVQVELLKTSNSKLDLAIDLHVVSKIFVTMKTLLNLSLS